MHLTRRKIDDVLNQELVLLLDLLPGQWVESVSATSQGTHQLLCVRCPDEEKPSSLGSASRDVIPNREARKYSEDMFFFFFLLQMKHQRSEAYGVESSWLLSADLNQKSFKTSSSWRSLSSLSVPRNPGGDGGRHLWEPSCMPTVPCCAVVSYSSLSCWTKNAHLLHVDVHSSWIFSF